MNNNVIIRCIFYSISYAEKVMYMYGSSHKEMKEKGKIRREGKTKEKTHALASAASLL